MEDKWGVTAGQRKNGFSSARALQRAVTALYPGASVATIPCCNVVSTLSMSSCHIYTELLPVEIVRFYCVKRCYFFCLNISENINSFDIYIYISYFFFSRTSNNIFFASSTCHSSISAFWNAWNFELGIPRILSVRSCFVMTIKSIRLNVLYNFRDVSCVVFYI